MTDENEAREPYTPKEPAPKQPEKSLWNRLPQTRRDRINAALRKAGISEPME